MPPTFAPILDTSIEKTKPFTANLAQAAGTYDLATVNNTGGIVIVGVDIYVLTAGATLTSVSIQTDDTTPEIILSALEGALANLTVGKNVVKAFSKSIYLHVAKKIQYTIVGATGSGSLRVVVRYRPIVNGGDIS